MRVSRESGVLGEVLSCPGGFDPRTKPVLCLELRGVRSWIHNSSPKLELL